MLEKRKETGDLGGTMRLGAYDASLVAGTMIADIYGDTQISERHRHRYEVNPEYVERLTAAGLQVAGVTPGMAGRGSGLVEAIELPDHPFFVGLQSHPEFRSRLMRPSPPFTGFIRAAVERAEARQGARPAAEAPSAPASADGTGEA